MLETWYAELICDLSLFRRVCSYVHSIDMTWLNTWYLIYAWSSDLICMWPVYWLEIFGMLKNVNCWTLLVTWSWLGECVLIRTRPSWTWINWSYVWTCIFMCMIEDQLHSSCSDWTVDRLHFSCDGWIIDHLHFSCSGWIVDQLHFSCSGWTKPWTLSDTSGKGNLGLLMRMLDCRLIMAKLSERWISCFRPTSRWSGKLGNLGWRTSS